MNQKDSNKFDDLLSIIEQNIKHSRVTNPNVSKVSVGWHLEHILIALRDITKVISRSDPSKYKWRFNIWRSTFLWAKRFPRGRAKAPKEGMPKGSFSEGELLNLLKETRETLATLPSLNEKQYFKHPYFGQLRKEKAISFMQIHTKHHLKIINDIMKKP